MARISLDQNYKKYVFIRYFKNIENVDFVCNLVNYLYVLTCNETGKWQGIVKEQCLGAMKEGEKNILCEIVRMIV